MSGCVGCDSGKTKAKAVVQPLADPLPLIAPKSENPEAKVKLEYCGGGMKRKTTGGCQSCKGGGKFSLVTTERIQFPSDDCKKGIFSQEFTAGRSYFVTEKQSERLLAMTFTAPSGQVAHKFKRVE